MRHKYRLDSPRSYCMSASYLMLFLSVGLLWVSVGCGCNEPKETSTVTWQAEAQSPGSWVATARSVTGGVPGTYFDVTEVYLNLRKASDSEATKILVFSHQHPTMRLRMGWTDATHLQVFYTDADVRFQAVRAADVEISLFELGDDADLPAVGDAKPRTNRPSANVR